MEKEFADSSIINALLNINNMVVNFDNSALKFQIRSVQTKNLENRAKIEEQKLKNKTILEQIILNLGSEFQILSRYVFGNII